MTTHEKIYDAIYGLLDELGIEKYVFVVSDPDSDLDICGGKGEACWRAGALQMKLRQTLREWDDDEVVEEE